jgi:hypothetical protein
VGEKSDAYRVIDLFSVIEAAVLHEKLCTLPAKLVLPDESLPLRDVLMAEGILGELDVGSDHAQVASVITSSLGRVPSPVRVAGSGDMIGLPIEFERIRPWIEDFLREDPSGVVADTKARLKRWPGRDVSDRDVVFYLPPNMFDSLDTGDFGGNAGEILRQNSFDDFGRQLIGWIEYHGSGAYEYCTSILRDMYYIIVAEIKGIPYWPQSTRVEFARRFPNFFEQNTRTRLYSKLAGGLKEDVKEVQRVLGERVFYIPPLSALVLDRSDRPSDVPKNILKVRKEFSTLRVDMDELDREMSGARTFGEIKKVSRKIESLSNKIEEKYKNRNNILIEKTIRLIPEIGKAAVATADPTKYGSALLSQPVEWLVDAIRNRPISKFFDLRQKVDTIYSYESLVSKLYPTVRFNRSR